MEYESGNTMNPNLAKSLGGSRRFMDTLLDEPSFAELSGKSAAEKFGWLVEQNRYYLIRKKDWEQIYENLEVNPESFARYYSLMRVNCESDDLNNMAMALMLNDELYSHTKELADSMVD